MVLATALLAASSCARKGAEDLGARRSRPIDLNNLTEPDSLLAALGRPGAATDPLLGAHALTLRSSVEITTAGLPIEKLDETARMDCDGKGNFHLLRDNSHRQGIEALGAGNLLYVRPRFAPFTSRRAEGDDAARLRALVEGQAGGILSVFSDWLEIKDGGRATREGRLIRSLALRRAESPFAARKRSVGGKWHESMQVSTLSGELMVDAATGVAREMTLDAAYTFVRESASNPIAVKLHFEQHTVPPDPIVPPVDALPSPRRPRPLLDKQTLLDGLVAGPREKAN